MTKFLKRKPPLVRLLNGIIIGFLWVVVTLLKLVCYSSAVVGEILIVFAGYVERLFEAITQYVLVNFYND